MNSRWTAALALAAVGIGACQLLLPERFAVNAPVAHMLFGRGADVPAEETIRGRMRAPGGFSVGIYADQIRGARSLLFTPAGDLLVSKPRAGEVVLLTRDGNGDGRADGTRILLEGLERPYGMDLRDGSLYVAEGSAIGRIAFDPASGSVSGGFERLVENLPSGGNHWTRTLRFGPDGWMYLTLGSSCNVCEESDPRRAAMLRFRPDGSEEQLFATGLRNTVGFDWQPGTNRLYGTDNGRDLLGDDFPPCELNEIREGGFYGWPYANGDRVPDPDLGSGMGERIAASIPPAFGFRAHNAPLGMTFVRGADAPSWLRGAALVALHGSWNRREKDGYKVVSLHWDEAGRIRERDFLTGFLSDDDVIGRPVDVAEGPDGDFYVSDDYSGSVWRVAAGSNGSATSLPARRSAESDAPLTAAQQADAARGALLYQRYECASCHEDAHAAEGVVVKPLTTLRQRFSTQELTELLATPPPPMPVFPLNELERRELSIYLRAQFP